MLLEIAAVQVVGQLFVEIDRLSAQVAGCEATPLQAPADASLPYLTVLAT